jgi:SpoIID/LytB domain protein
MEYMLRKQFVYLCICLFVALFIAAPIHAQGCTLPDCDASGSDCQDRLRNAQNKCTEAISQLEAAKQPQVSELQKLQASITAFQNRIKGIEVELVIKANAIAEGEKQLSGLLTVAYDRIRQFYMRSVNSSPFFIFLSSTNVGSALRTYGYQQAVVNEDKKIITQTALLVKDLENRKTVLENEKATIFGLKADFDKKAAAVKQLLDSANAYESVLSNTLAAVTAKQQAFLAQKLAGLGIPLFAISGGGCSSDLTNGKDPGFGGGFGFFSFGVPNRVGLNQYGAWGRAKANQDYQTILRAYYNFDSIERKDATINVDGYKGYSLDDYVKRVYEVPATWTDNDSAALKAQAIAIRSYALAYTNNGQGSICTTQQCQVFKPDPKTDNNNAWINAVDATTGLVMVQGGNPIKAFFSSTHGGYAFNTGDLAGWSNTSYTKRMVDTSGGSVSSFSDLRNSAYDKDSPWFYCDWGARSQYGGTAWLKPEEVADIANVMLLVGQDSSAQKHVVQTDKPNPDGTDTWDAATVRSKLGDAAYNSVSNVTVNADFGTGRVTNVTVSGDGKTNTFSLDTFKLYFNLRAPANIQIVGPLFNVERK